MKYLDEMSLFSTADNICTIFIAILATVIKFFRVLKKIQIAFLNLLSSASG